MASQIDRIRDLPNKVRFRSDKRTEGATDLPLDHRLTFSPSTDEKWTFEDEHIFFNGFDANDLINESGTDVHYLSGLSAALDQYRQFVWMRGGKSAAKFNGTVNALLEKILGRLGGIYEGMFSGVHFEYNGGDFWINGVNINAVLKLYKLRPTRKARCYLVGLRNKLGLLLSSQSGSHRCDGVAAEAERIFSEIAMALDSIAPDDADLCLPAHGTI